MTEFIYTTYIKATPEKIWNAITTPEFTRQYWGHELISDWKKGSKWKSVPHKGEECNAVVGDILESQPPKKLVMTWAPIDLASDKAEQSRVTFEIETMGEVTRLTVLHDKLAPGSFMDGRVQQGWPLVLSNMKSFLETGKTYDIWSLKNSVIKAA